MKFASAISLQGDWRSAVADLKQQVAAAFGETRRDLAVLFLHTSFAPEAVAILESVLIGIRPRHLIGCTGAGIIGVETEVEQKPAMSLLVAELPGVEIRPFQVTQEEIEEAAGPAFWHFQIGVSERKKPNFILFADPFSIQSTALVQMISAAYCRQPVVGGLASGGLKPGVNRLFLDAEVIEAGAVGLALSGDVELHTMVAQGCKPIGEPFTITKAEKNIILELGGRPPLEVLQEMLPHLSKGDQQLAQKALVLGRVIDEYQEEHRRGDFLIRNLIGHDPQSGALAVGDWVHIGQTVQFQVRDGVCADQDLRDVLGGGKRALGGVVPMGSLLFSCLGRGEGMYGARNHDIKLLHEYFGAVPTAGLFCNGEIGPVGGQSFVHGFTSVLGVFTEPTKHRSEKVT